MTTFITIPSPIGYLFRSLREADFPKLLCYIGFGKSYLIPETTNFDIGEGIVINFVVVITNYKDLIINTDKAKVILVELLSVISQGFKFVYFSIRCTKLIGDKCLLYLILCF